VLAALAAGEARPLRLPTPIAVEVEWSDATVAHACALVPSVAPAGPRTVAYEAANAVEALQVFEVLTRLAQSVAD
jgi:D-aminopeptidase